MAPKKPTHVDVKALQQVLSDLQDLQDHVSKPPPDSFDSLGDTIESDLKQGDNGLQRNGAQIAGTRYHEATVNFTQGWGDVKTGIGSLITLVQQTIAKHSGADSDAATSARTTNTTQQPAGPAGAR